MPNGGGFQSFLEALPQPLRASIERRARVIRVPRGRTIVTAGSHSSDVYVLVEGRADVLLYSSDGREVSVRVVEAGETFGELSAIDGGVRSASVVAATDMRVLVLNQDEFLACLDAAPQASLWLVRKLVRETRRLTEKVFELSALNVRARLHCELLRIARLNGPDLIVRPAPTHAELANRIGTHREAVTREMRQLVASQVIRAGRRQLEFLNLARLVQSVGRAIG